MPQRTLVLLALLGAALLALVHATLLTPSAAQQAAEDEGWSQRLATARWKGKVAPDFSGLSLGGEVVNLGEIVGHQVVVLNFFATWCGPCRAETPELLRFAHQFANEPVVLLGIAGDEGRDKIEAYVRDLGITFPVVVDSEESALHRFGVRSYPTTVVVGADGRVKLYETGAIFNADVVLRPIVAEQVAEIAGGRGIDHAAYLAAAEEEDYDDVLVSEPKPRPGDRLDGRALEIARAMPCPCGCTDLVATCRCSTAKRIREELAKTEFGTRSDDEVIVALNEKYCIRTGKT